MVTRIWTKVNKDACTTAHTHRNDHDFVTCLGMSRSIFCWSIYISLKHTLREEWRGSVWFLWCLCGWRAVEQGGQIWWWSMPRAMAWLLAYSSFVPLYSWCRRFCLCHGLLVKARFLSLCFGSTWCRRSLICINCNYMQLAFLCFSGSSALEIIKKGNYIHILDEVKLIFSYCND